MTPVTLARCEGCAAAEAERDDANDALAELAEILTAVTGNPNILRSDIPKIGETTVRATTTIRSRGQVTIPPKIRRAMGVDEGDALEFSIDEAGNVTMRALRLVPVEVPK
jgi:AbrB family looped-hinge helix DNA binding protein